MKLTAACLATVRACAKGPCSPLSMPLAWCSTPQMARISDSFPLITAGCARSRNPWAKERRSWLQPTPYQVYHAGDVMGAGGLPCCGYGLHPAV